MCLKYELTIFEVSLDSLVANIYCFYIKLCVFNLYLSNSQGNYNSITEVDREKEKNIWKIIIRREKIVE